MQDLINKIAHGDCLEVMKTIPDKSIDLVLTDPPYGKKYARGENGWGICENRPKLEDVAWDNDTPKKEVFTEIIRISKNQIIFGGNYFTDKLPVSNCWIFWDKIGGNINKSVFADGELVWTSFNKVVRKYISISMGFIKDDRSERIHPTQKPVDLFKMILNDYSKENDIILDCFSGSGTTAIACSELKRNFICIEKDKQYYEASCQRLENYNKQLKLF